MTHRIHAISDGKIAGFAVTVQMDKAEGAPSEVTPRQAAIDTASKDSVYVMAVAEGDDIAGIGGLMATAMNARGLSGAVIDGGVRDVAYLKKIAFPVYASGIVPSTSVGHYRATQGVPVTAGGVRVSPGDIIVADADGVVTVSKDIAAEVLVKAQALDQTEHSMYGTIEKLRAVDAGRHRVGGVRPGVLRVITAAGVLLEVELLHLRLRSGRPASRRANARRCGVRHSNRSTGPICRLAVVAHRLPSRSGACRRP
jgi:regulator of RNase E activity RraA